MRNVHKILVGKTDRKRPLKRRRTSWWEGRPNVKIDIKETGWKGVGRIQLAHDRDQWWYVKNTVMNFRVP
jgi:hypothetical protein